MRRRRADPAAKEVESGDASALAKVERYALDLLAVRPRTVRELAARLRSKGYEHGLVEDTVARCLGAGYLNDREFAEYWVEERCRSNPCGPARLRQELGRKGVPAEVVAAVLAERLVPAREVELAVRVARKKAGAGPQAKERLWSFLRRRGFGGEACREAVKAVWGPLEELADSEPPADDDASESESDDGSGPET